MAKHATPDLKPTGKVSSISASRTNNTRAIVAKWKVPSSLKSTTDDAGRKRFYMSGFFVMLTYISGVLLIALGLAPPV